MRTAPHLCRPIEFVFPGYRGERPALATLGVGIALYNALALWRPPAAQPARSTPRDALRAGAPPAQRRARGRAGLRRLPDRRRAPGAGERARRRGGRRRGRQPPAPSSARRAIAAAGPAARWSSTRETGARFEVRARARGQRDRPVHRRLSRPAAAAACARRWACTWCSTPRACRIGGRALVLRSPRDNRLFFVLPAGPRTIVGTTDTDLRPPRRASAAPGSDDEIRARGADVAYLLEAAQPRVPRRSRSRPTTWCRPTPALRPLLAGNAHTPSETSREHEICARRDGLIVVAGGKLTTLRRMARGGRRSRRRDRCAAAGVERAIEPCATADPPAARAPGRCPTPSAARALAGRRDGTRSATPTARRADRVLELAAESARARRSGSIPSCPISGPRSSTPPAPSTRARSPTLLVRRVPLFRDAARSGLGAAAQAASLAARRARLGRPRAASATLAGYRAAVDRSRRWRASSDPASPHERSRDVTPSMRRAARANERRPRSALRAREPAGGG